MMKNLVEESLRAYQLSIAQLPNAFVAEDEQVLLISSGVQLKKSKQGTVTGALFAYSHN